MQRKGNTIGVLDVGKTVRSIMFERGINKARLSRILGRDAAGVRGMIQRTSMQTYLVWELSVALKHNFFSDLAAQFATATGIGATEIEQLRHELERTREERDYLRKALDMLNPRT